MSTCCRPRAGNASPPECSNEEGTMSRVIGYAALLAAAALAITEVAIG